MEDNQPKTKIQLPRTRKSVGSDNKSEISGSVFMKKTINLPRKMMLKSDTSMCCDYKKGGFLKCETY